MVVRGLASLDRDFDGESRGAEITTRLEHGAERTKYLPGPSQGINEQPGSVVRKFWRPTIAGSQKWITYLKVTIFCGY